MPPDAAERIEKSDGFGLVTPIRWPEIALIWAYSITWSFVTDWAKIAVYESFEKSSHRHRNVLSMLGKQVHPTAANPVRPPGT